MKELSLHVLDIVQNSITAGSTIIDLSMVQEGPKLTLKVVDDGCGMSEEMVRVVSDPFTTSRTTRKVGMGIPLIKMTAEMTGGDVTIESTLGKGTTVTASFFTDNIDCPPLGNMPSTITLLVQALREGQDLLYTRVTDKGSFLFDTRQIRDILGPDVPFTSPDVLMWVSEFIRENEDEIS